VAKGAVTLPAGKKSEAEAPAYFRHQGTA